MHAQMLSGIQNDGLKSNRHESPLLVIPVSLSLFINLHALSFQKF